MPAPHRSVFTGRCPSCHPTNSVKALKAQNLGHFKNLLIDCLLTSCRLYLLGARPGQQSVVCSRRHAECAPSIVVQILVRRRVLISALTDPMSDRVQGFHVQRLPLKRQQFNYTELHFEVNYNLRWLGRRVVSVLDSGAEGLSSNRSRHAVR